MRAATHTHIHTPTSTHEVLTSSLPLGYSQEPQLSLHPPHLQNLLVKRHHHLRNQRRQPRLPQHIQLLHHLPHPHLHDWQQQFWRVLLSQPFRTKHTRLAWMWTRQKRLHLCECQVTGGWTRPISHIHTHVSMHTHIHVRTHMRTHMPTHTRTHTPHTRMHQVTGGRT